MLLSFLKEKDWAIQEKETAIKNEKKAKEEVAGELFTKRGAHDAVSDIQSNLLKGRYLVWDADLSRYFDTIPHTKLIKLVAEPHCRQKHISFVEDMVESASYHGGEG